MGRVHFLRGLYLCSNCFTYAVTASRMTCERDGTSSFWTSSSIVSRSEMGKVAVMLAIRFDLFLSIFIPFSVLGSIRLDGP